MGDLTQTISNLVGILLGLVGVVGVGYFIYGAYLYLTASGAPNQMERGKSAMMTALAGIVLAMVAYGVVELVMNAVVGNTVDPSVPDPTPPPTKGSGQGRYGMREHEVPTHVQAEDRVLLWLTFPQIVAVVAMCAVAYGAYRYFPVGPAEFRLGVAVLLGALGIAMTVGRVGGRGLPLVAADLLKFNLGARSYAGSVSELVRSEVPIPEPAEHRPNPVLQLVKAVGRVVHGLVRVALPTRRAQPTEQVHSEAPAYVPVQAKPDPLRLLKRKALSGADRAVQAARRKFPALVRTSLPPRSAQPMEQDFSEIPTSEPVEAKPDPLRLLIRKALSGTGRAVKAARRRGRPPFRAHVWFGKRRSRGDGDKGKTPKNKESRSRKHRRLSVSLAALALAIATLPALALADGPWSDDAWRLDEIGYPPPEPVPGRRLYLEEITVTGTLAMVTVRAATELRLDVRSYGGDSGRVLTFFVHDILEQGETERFGLSLDGPGPSFTLAWQDGLGQTGALALKGRQLPHPMPAVEGRACNLSVDTLAWTPGTLTGVIVSECADELEEQVKVAMAAGHHQQSVDALLPATVSGVTGTVSVSAGVASASVAFVQDGETRFTLPVAAGETVHEVTMEATLSASLSVPLPPLVQLTHHPHRVEQRTETVSLLRPGVSRYVSRTVSVALPPDGQVVNYTIGATLSVPSETVQQDVTLDIDHPEHVRAEVVQRDALARTTSETVTMSTTLAADRAYATLSLPDPTPTPAPVTHRPLSDEETRELFNRDHRREFP